MRTLFSSSARQRKRDERERQQALGDESRNSGIDAGSVAVVVVDLADVEAKSAEDVLVERRAAFILWLRERAEFCAMFIPPPGAVSDKRREAR